MSATEHLRKIRSFVRRAGRMSARQRLALEAYWPQYGLEVAQGSLDLTKVFNNTQPVVLEIGFGMGDALYEMAKQHSDKNFIGVEVHTPGVGSLLARLVEDEISNVKVFAEDVFEVLQHCLADNSLTEVNIFFPDPWPKKRHHKRRLIQQAFLDALLPKLKAGGQLHVATDWQHYAEEILGLLNAESRLKNLASDNAYIKPRPSSRPLTKFEKRGQQLEHAIFDLVFEKF